ncbi:hypothetical protein [Mesorhizobium sp. M7A.F.Ca.MR.176.00.0.0]|uniref:hypothetical protein n=1 Tax=Mesorhizobium sp. M7A.F.Ca.MR.176.00.0.0 TaxID=2496776 RepID=UPI0013E37969|nr:hypothetical protein [Mesorhizobium sp. M7A.F.Ca.MR.176.00.0.0]
MAVDIIFCAKTGHQIVGDNVVPFPHLAAKPTPAENETKPTPVEAVPVPENDDI